MNLFGHFLGDDPTDDCCVFPFTYDNITFNQCTKTDHNQTWCATEVDAYGNYNGNWKNCNENCKKGETFIHIWIETKIFSWYMYFKISMIYYYHRSET